MQRICQEPKINEKFSFNQFADLQNLTDDKKDMAAILHVFRSRKPWKPLLVHRLSTVSRL